jgi:hypothetical protein
MSGGVSWITRSNDELSILATTQGTDNPVSFSGALPLTTPSSLSLVRSKAVSEKPSDANVERAASKLAAGINESIKPNLAERGEKNTWQKKWLRSSSKRW